MNSIPAEGWTALERWIALNPDPAPGLYRLWPGSKNALARRNRINKDSLRTCLIAFHAIVSIPFAFTVRDLLQRKPADPPHPIRSVPAPSYQYTSQLTPSPPLRKPVAEEPAANLAKELKDAQDQVQKDQQPMFDSMRRQLDQLPANHAIEQSQPQVKKPEH
jgi:hypothetical protein